MKEYESNNRSDTTFCFDCGSEDHLTVDEECEKPFIFSSKKRTERDEAEKKDRESSYFRSGSREGK